MHLAAGLEVMRDGHITAVIAINALLAGGLIAFIGHDLGSEPPATQNGCTSAEAYVAFSGRDTCYPAQFLPVELKFYLEPEE